MSAPVNAQNQVSVVMCTRDRGDSAIATVISLLACTHPSFELVIVDQTADSSTRDALVPWTSDPRVTYLADTGVGLGRARNVGLARARSEIVLYTDDDVTVPPDWITVMSAVFAKQPRVAVAFCNVVAGPHDASAGFVPDYLRSRDVPVRTLWQKCQARGIGAGLAVRRSAMIEVGGFDAQLGAGGRFPSCEDGDVAVRAILHGWEVFETAEVAVVHHGFRTWEEGKALSKRNWYGVGGAYSKPLKCGRRAIAAVLLAELVEAGLSVFRPVLRRRRPSGLRGPWYLVRGVIDGLRLPVDCQTMVFVEHDG